MSATETGQTETAATSQGEGLRRGLYLFAMVLVVVFVIVVALAFVAG